jgi:hypothetical protein
VYLYERHRVGLQSQTQEKVKLELVGSAEVELKMILPLGGYDCILYHGPDLPCTAAMHGALPSSCPEAGFV